MELVITLYSEVNFSGALHCWYWDHHSSMHQSNNVINVVNDFFMPLGKLQTLEWWRLCPWPLCQYVFWLSRTIWYLHHTTTASTFLNCNSTLTLCIYTVTIKVSKLARLYRAQTTHYMIAPCEGTSGYQVWPSTNTPRKIEYRLQHYSLKNGHHQGPRNTTHQPDHTIGNTIPPKQVQLAPRSRPAHPLASIPTCTNKVQTNRMTVFN